MNSNLFKYRGVILSFLFIVSSCVRADIDPASTIYNVFNSGLEFESSAEKNKATLSLAFPVNYQHNLKVELSGATNDEGTGEFGDLDGLSKGAKVKLTYAYSSYDEHEYPIHPKAILDEWAALNDKVKEIDKSIVLKTRLMNGNNDTQRIASCKNDDECKKLIEDKKKALEKLESFRNDAQKQRVIYDEERFYHVDYLFSVAANRSDFDVFDTDDLSSDSSSEIGLSVGPAIRFYTGEYTRVKLGFDFQRIYEQKGKTTKYCLALTEGSELLTCREGNTTDVTKEYRRNIYAQIGGYTENKYLRGWEAIATHDLASSKTALSFPMYFYESDKGAVNAGVKFNFIINGDDDDDSSTVFVFIGSALDIF